MNAILRNSLYMLAAGALAVSCADYNTTDDFTAQPDPAFVEPYKDLAPVKTYINREQYPNMTIGATLKVTDFNRQELAHAAAITNFDNVSFGSSLMSGAIINERGVINFIEMKDLLDHVDEIGGEVFGSPIVANTGQADGWLNLLTSPIEIFVDFVEGKTVNYNEMSVGAFKGTVDKGKASIAKYDNQNALKIEQGAKVRIIEDFEVDSLATYTTTFYVRSDKNAIFTIVFSGNNVEGPTAGKYNIQGGGNWKRIVVESKAAKGETQGYLRIDNSPATPIYVQRVEMGYMPDNHRPQTDKEINDTINYALRTWCDGLMKTNAGRINSFDLIDEAIDAKSELENGMYDLRHSSDKFYWQDILGSENYGATVSKLASDAYEKYGGNPSELRFFISESGLDDPKKVESLNYWIKIWTDKGAKIDGINAKLNLTYSEDPETQAANEAAFNRLLDNLAATGKLIRLSNFDIKYADATGVNVTAAQISPEQRQKLADCYAKAIKSYMTKIPHEKQAGICKGNLIDTGDPVGLWSVDTKSKDWVRTATYKAFCDALSGK